MLNLKVRMKHKTFLVALFALVMLLAQQLSAVLGVDVSIYNEQVTDLFNTVLSILVLLGVVVDPTTDGMSDSKKAMNYKVPKKDVE